MWVRAEEKIRNQKPRSKSSGRGRQPLFPSLEKDLHDEFKTMRREGKIVKRWWFNTRMTQSVKERNSETSKHQIVGFPLLSKVWSSSSQENTPCPESPRAAEKHNNEVPFKDLARAKKKKVRRL